MIVGRFICGVALDRSARAPVVAAVAMGLPGLGCLLVASPWDSFAVLVVAVCCLGAAWGAEGDVVAYLVARRFGLTIYSTVLSVLMAAIGVSSCARRVRSQSHAAGQPKLQRVPDLRGKRRIRRRCAAPPARPVRRGGGPGMTMDSKAAQPPR